MTFFEKLTDSTTPMHWSGDMQADYLYPNGVAGNRFFKHIINKDTFLAAKCTKCCNIFFPPRLYCEDCFEEISEDNWFEIPAQGEIILHTLVTIDTYGKILRKPKIIGMIKIDKTDSSLIGLIETDNPHENLDGLKVEAVFKPKKEREGNLKDILYFKKK
jgi:uncharacterized OB-fold protein